jgi:gluconate 5-dehydrogenase
VTTLDRAPPPSADNAPAAFDLTGQTAVITGAGGHLGRAMAQAFAESGARVVCSEPALEPARDVAAGRPTPRGQHHGAVVLDNLDPDVIDRGMEEAIEQYGPIDALVCNGFYIRTKSRTTAAPEASRWQRINDQLMQVNGYYRQALAVYEHARAPGRSARIVLLGSIQGMTAHSVDREERQGNKLRVGYMTAKAGIIHLACVLGAHWMPDGVRVNCLSPGAFPSP